MTTTPDLQTLVGPGQQDVLDQFLEEVEQQHADIAAAEQGQPQEQDAEQLLAGKFKSTEELEKAYLEAQKLISSRGKQAEEAAAPAPLTKEEATQHYGEFIANAAAEEGLDLGAWDSKVRNGEDTAELRQKLSAKTGIPVQLIEQYEQAYRPQPAGDSPAAGLSEADVSELKGMVGGDAAFAQLSEWAAANLTAEELADYNAAIDSGNKAAARFAIKQLHVRASSKADPGEPELLGGGKPTTTEVFESDQQAIEAMRKTNSKGQRLYNVDPKYRAWYEKTLQRSNVFI